MIRSTEKNLDMTLVDKFGDEPNGFLHDDHSKPLKHIGECEKNVVSSTHARSKKLARMILRDKRNRHKMKSPPNVQVEILEMSSS